MESNNTDHLSWTGTHSRKDFLTKIETEIQQYWESQNIFDVDAMETDNVPSQKYYIAVPPVVAYRGAHIDLPLYRAEFTAGYQRLRGKNVLFALGITKAGIQHLFKQVEQWNKDQKENSGEKESRKVPWLSKKLEDIGVGEDEISTLTEERLTDIIVNNYKKNVRALGFKVDLRRSFSSWNSLYASFLKWQFTKMRLHDRLVSAMSYGRYSRMENYFLTSDQDLRLGEGDIPKRFVVVKQLLLEPYPKIISEYEGQREIYLLTSCARPGLAIIAQTNIWAMPEEDYGLYEFKDNLLVICSPDAATHLAYQNFSAEFGAVKCLKSFTGADLIGARAQTPSSNHKEVYVWPALKNQGWKKVRTGLGISCPSINIMDCYLWKQVREKEGFRKKYNLDDSQVLPFDFLDLISTQRGLLRDREVRTLEMEVNQLHQYYFDEFLYEFFVPLVNLQGFTADNITQFFKNREDELLDKCTGLVYYCTEGEVILRTGEKVIVACNKSNAINYGSEGWINRVADRLKNMDLGDHERNTLERDALYRLTRDFWNYTRDWNFDIFTDYKADAINFVSSSTLCSAFSAIYHLIARYNIEPKDLTYDVYEYIFGNINSISDTGIDIKVLDEFRKEFKYWMPADVELFTSHNIRNIGLFTIFDSIDLLGEKNCPKSFSLSPAAFRNIYRLRVQDRADIILPTYPADAIRLVLAGILDARDDTVYYEKEDLNTSVMQLTREFKWIHQVLNSDSLLDSNGVAEFPEKLFANQINQAIISTTEAFENNKFKDAVKEGFYQLMSYRDNYRSFCESSGRSMNKALIHCYIRTLVMLISPICPHITEHIWLNLMKEKDSILNAKWPEADPVHQETLQINEYLSSVVSNAHTRKNAFIKKQVPKMHPGILEHAFIAVTDQYRGVCAVALKVYYDYIAEYPHEYPLHERKVSQLMSTNPHTSPQKTKAIQFINSLKGRIAWIPGGASLLVDQIYRFNERKVLEENKRYLASKLGVKQVTILDYTSDCSYEGVSQPYSPSIIFNNNKDPQQN
jgi:leucyl-tRNA synthetase